MIKLPFFFPLKHDLSRLFFRTLWRILSCGARRTRRAEQSFPNKSILVPLKGESWNRLVLELKEWQLFLIHLKNEPIKSHESEIESVYGV